MNPSTNVDLLGLSPNRRTITILSRELAMRFHRAVRLWVLLHCLYGIESRWISHLPQPFTYPDLRNRLFSEKHPKSDRLNAQAILAGCSDHGCICHDSVINLLQDHFSPETWGEWQQQLKTLTGWSDTELQQQLEGYPFATVHRNQMLIKLDLPKTNVYR
ncbi:MAG: hypothetical protein ACRCU2_32700 [Planktothrix sp.]